MKSVKLYISLAEKGEDFGDLIKGIPQQSILAEMSI